MPTLWSRGQNRARHPRENGPPRAGDLAHPTRCRCRGSRHDNVIAEAAVAALQAGNRVIDLFEWKPLMLEHREIEQSAPGQLRHLLPLRGREPVRADELDLL